MTVEITAKLLDRLESDSTLAGWLGADETDARIYDEFPGSVKTLTTSQPAYVIVAEDREEGVEEPGGLVVVALGDQSYRIMVVANRQRLAREIRDRIRDTLMARSLATDNYLIDLIRYDGSRPHPPRANGDHLLELRLELSGIHRLSPLEIAG